MTTLLVGPDEAAHLAGYLARLTRWDSGAAVRLQGRGRLVGVFAAPPLDCLTVVVLPLAEPVAATDQSDGTAAAPPGPDLDVVVSAGRLRDVLGDVTTARTGARPMPLPDDVGPVAGLAVLPPRAGWVPADRGTAGDVIPLVDAAVADFRAAAAAAPDADPAARQRLADEVWSRPGWGGMPLQSLHAARSLGMLAHSGFRVESATAPGWKRLMTPAGHVFVRTTGAPARLSLAVLS